MKFIENLRTAKVTTSSGTDVRDTQMLSGEAKDSLSGTNETVQYTTSGSGAGTGPYGGQASNK